MNYFMELNAVVENVCVLPIRATELFGELNFMKFVQNHFWLFVCL
jgi:hypothetical protein